MNIDVLKQDKRLILTMEDLSKALREVNASSSLSPCFLWWLTLRGPEVWEEVVETLVICYSKYEWHETNSVSQNQV